MFTYKGGAKVGTGTYWDLGQGSSVDMEMAGTLPGDAETTFVRIPIGVMLLAGPLVGLLYVVLLPFAWIVAAAVIITKQAIHGLVSLATKSTSFGWRPIEAYLAGKRKGKSGT